MVEESEGLSHIQEGFIPTDIHLSYIHIAPAFKPGCVNQKSTWTSVQSFAVCRHEQSDLSEKSFMFMERSEATWQTILSAKCMDCFSRQVGIAMTGICYRESSPVTRYLSPLLPPLCSWYVCCRVSWQVGTFLAFAAEVPEIQKREILITLC
jgi:hypothetical protein